MIHPPEIRGGALVRWPALVFGLALFALGIVLLLESGLGLSPWDVLNQGVSDHTRLSFGQANVAVAFVVLGGAWLLGARIGPGTVANAVLVGVFVDALLRIGSLDALGEAALPWRIAQLVAGIAVIGVGSGFYIGASLGAGPRDSLMLVLAFRTGVRIGVVRGALEAAVTVVGFALGGTVGIGTLAFVVGIGPAVELAFAALVGLRLARPSVG
ncbi:MAG: YczE/YyaS/YitT family protein [Gaiella sp.]